MRIKKITLENFRCFERQELDLSADVVAMYGRNGVGKTAIFDALEWALLGEIGRYAGETSAPDYLAHVFTEQDPKVRVDFDEHPDWVEVTRKRGRSSGGNLSSGSGKAYHRDFLYAGMLNSNYSGPRREVAPVRDFLRSVALLSQDSIRDFVESDPAGRAGVLACITGAATLQKRLDRAEEVQRTAEKRRKQKKREVAEAEESAGELKAKLAELEARIKEIRRGLEASTTLRDVLCALQEAEIEYPESLERSTDEEAEEIAATVRGVCTEKSEVLQERQSCLAKLEAMSQQHPARVKRREELADMVKNGQARLKELLNEENRATAAITEAERSLESLEESVQSLSSRLASLNELAQTMRQYFSQLQNLRDLESKKELASKRLEQARADAERRRAALDRATSEANDKKGMIEQLSQREAALESVLSGFKSYESAVRQEAASREEIERLEQERGAHEAQAVELRRRQSELQNRLAEEKRDLASRQAATEKAQQLLAQIKEYATGRICPLCGNEYSSDAELQEAIQSQTEGLGAGLQLLAKRLHTLSTELSDVRASLKETEEKLEQIRQSLKAENERRRSARQSVQEFHELATKAGVSPELEQAKDAIEYVQEQIALQRRQMQEQEQKIQEHVAAESRATKEVEHHEAELASVSCRVSEVTAKLNEIRNRAQNSGVPLDEQKAEKEIAERIKAAQEQLAREQDKKEKIAESAAKARGEREASRKERTRLEMDMKEWEDTLALLGSEIEEFRGLCRSLNLEEDSSPQSIDTLRARLEEKVARIAKARQTAEDYYRSCRAMALQREQDEDTQQLNIAEERLRGLREGLRGLQAAAKTVRSWTKPLAQSVDKMVERRLEAHRGEITRLFRGLIPNPYMFDGIEISRDSKGVHLGLKYRGKKNSVGEPRFFLSSAQANVLALAIFLSFAERQRWSNTTAQDRLKRGALVVR